MGPASLVSPVLSILLWPLVVYHELIQRMYTRLEPVLMKLDYSMKAETLHHKHEKKSEALASPPTGQPRGRAGGHIHAYKMSDGLCSGWEVALRKSPQRPWET